MSSTVEMNQHFSIPALLKITVPSIVMMLFTSIYGIVDGLFVSNFAGKTAFAAVNLIMPFIMILGTVGFMVGAGGSALVAQARGEGKDAQANRWFSLLVYFAASTGIALAILGFIFMEQIALLLGASEDMLDLCVLYGRISMISLPAFILQYAFQSLFNTAGKPGLGLKVTVASGVVNIILDLIFVGFMGLGVAGAAGATVASELVGGIVPLIYFARPNSSHLKLGATKFEGMVIAKSCVNGSSEMIENIAMSLVSVLYNLQLMTLYGEDGVAAYGALMYVALIFCAVSIGYAMGVLPLMGYQYGAKNKIEMQSLWKKSMFVTIVCGVVMFMAAQVMAYPLAYIFTGYDESLLALTENAFHLYFIAILICGFSIYASSLFTSLGNGIISGIIAIFRTLVFECGAIILLPMIFGAGTIWLSWTVGECFAMMLTFTLMFAFGKHYGYLPSKKETTEANS